MSHLFRPSVGSWERRTVRAFVILALALVAASCDWPTYGFNGSGGRFNSTETAIGVGNVAHLDVAWSASGSFTSPVVANGFAYVGDFASGNQGLEVFDAKGSIGCSGVPKSCTPVWKGTTGGTTGIPTVANGVVYVGSSQGLYAFDAKGVTGCSGAPPATCDPLWVGTVTGGVGTPVVVNGVAYAGGGPAGSNRLYAFDASGTAGCSGTPKTCAPLWSAPIADYISSTIPAVANGVVYVGADSSFNTPGLYAFDASGMTNCAGTPKVCQPLWLGDIPDIVGSSPAVVNGVVYIAALEANLEGELGGVFAFKASGDGCPGTPKVCQPLWATGTSLRVQSSPAVANGKVYVGTRGLDFGGENVRAFNASNGAPLWSSGQTDFRVESSPAVANGVAYNASTDGNVYAYDAAIGTPLWSGAVGLNPKSPTIANGFLYVSSNSGLFAFTPS